MIDDASAVRLVLILSSVRTERDKEGEGREGERRGGGG